MGFMEKLKSFIPSNDYDDYDDYDEYEEDGDQDYTSESQRESARTSDTYRGSASSSSSYSSYSSERGSGSGGYSYRTSHSTDKRDPKIINFQATTQVQVVIQKPVSFDEARSIADHLNAKRTVVLNLETTDDKEAHRLFDYLCGAAYANSCGFKKIANRTFLITPVNVDVMGDALLDELESGGYFS